MAYRKNPITLEAEARLLRKLRRELAKNGGNRLRTARAMGISERHVYRLLRKLESTSK